MIVYEARWSKFYADTQQQKIYYDPDVPVLFETEDRCKRWLEWKAAEIWCNFFLRQFPGMEWSDDDNGESCQLEDPGDSKILYDFTVIFHATEDEGV